MTDRPEDSKDPGVPERPDADQASGEAVAEPVPAAAPPPAAAMPAAALPAAAAPREPGWFGRTVRRKSVQLVGAGLVGVLLGGGVVGTVAALSDGGRDGAMHDWRESRLEHRGGFGPGQGGFGPGQGGFGDHRGGPGAND